MFTFALVMFVLMMFVVPVLFVLGIAPFVAEFFDDVTKAIWDKLNEKSRRQG